MGNKIDPKIEVLRQFRKYESTLYSYLKVDYNTKDSENLKFYLIPDKYAVALTGMFKYKDNIKELDELNTYLDCEDNLKEKEKEMIIEDLLNEFKKKNNSIFEIQIEVEKVKNKEMLDEKNSFKLNNEGVFIPLTSNIWKAICQFYNNDIKLRRYGFINKGELSIITENKRIDTLFVEEETGDHIYHFCLIMKNEIDSNKVISFLKRNSIKFLLDKLEIKHVGLDIENNKFSKINKTIPSDTKAIGNLHIEVYFIGFHIFHEKNIYFIPKEKVFPQSNESIKNIHYLNKMKENYNYYQSINNQSQNANNINTKSNIVKEDISVIKSMKRMMNFGGNNMVPVNQLKESNQNTNIFQKMLRAKSNNNKKYNNNNNNNFINNNNYNNYNVFINVGNNQNFIMSNTLLDMNKPQSSKVVCMNINPIVSGSSSSKELDLNKESNHSSHEEMTKKFQLSTFFSDDFSSNVNVFIQCFLNSQRIKKYFTKLSNEKIDQNKSSLLSLFYFLQKEMNSKNGNGNNINNCLENIYKYLKKYININSSLNDVIALILNILYKGNKREAEREIKNDIYIDKLEAKKIITQGSEISLYYNGTKKKKYLCTKCQKRNYKYKAFNILSIDVDKLFSDNDNSLNDSIFHFDFRNYLIKGTSKTEKSSKYACKNCSNKKFIKSTYINRTCPNLLFISFEKQQDFIQQYSFSIDLIIDLNMNRYIENKNPEVDYKYYLNSFIIYDSSQADYATYLNYKRRIWLKMNKKGMKQIQNISEEMNKIINPKILVYERY